MKIESLKLRNFKAFRDAELKEVPRFCAVVGANGTGKSSFFSLFGFLKDAFETNVKVALARLGGSRGFDEVRTRGARGPIVIEIKFREKTGAPLITYSLSIGKRAGHPVVLREVLKYRRGSSGKPWHFLDFRHGKGYAVSNEMAEVKDPGQLKREEQELRSPDILAIRGLAQFQKFPAVMALGRLIENWYVSDFHISAARNEPEAGYAEHLSREGGNLALVTEYLHEHHPKVFRRILQTLARRVPGIERVEPKITEEGRVLLKFQDGNFKDPFLARYVSDGTIKMFAYLVLLYDPNPHPLLCVEEPENQLYPTLLYELAEEFRAYARRGGQVFVSTHSPEFLNALDVDEVFLLVKEDGVTVIRRASDVPQIAAYMSNGAQMGWLWREGHFRGVNP